MIYQLRPSVRALAVVTAVAVAGLVPSLTEPAHADGPIRAHAQRKASKSQREAPKRHHKAPRMHHQVRPVAKPAKVVFTGGGPRVPVKPGTVYNWPYSVTNQGPVRAAGVTLQTPLAAGLEFVSAQGSCSFQGTAPVCQIGDLAPGQTMTGLITAKVSVTALAGQAVLNTAKLTWAGSKSSGAFPATSIAETTDLVVTKSGPATVRPGETATYDVTVRNQGPATADQVVLNDNVAPVRAGQAVPVTLLDSPAGCSADNTGTVGAPGLVCAMGDLAVGAVKTVTVRLKVGPKAKPGTVLQAPAKAATSTFDTDLANNNAAVRTKITAPIRLAADHLNQLNQLPETGADNQIFIDLALGMLGLGLIFLRLGRSRGRGRRD